ncbi:PQQ-like beta-propeller repeat protein, partial [bacterium]|nr:PQQ-like beta-propeller repeat protein [bacterium]
GQEKVLQTILLQIIALLLLILWILFLSRVAWKTRLLTFGAVVLILVGIGSLVRVREVSGNLVPKLTWRWTKQTHATPVVDVQASAYASTEENELGESRRFMQFLGSDRNAKVESVRLERDWQAHPPKLVWRKPIGAGWSAFSVKGNLAVTQEQHGPNEMVVCRDLLTGSVIWTHSDDERYATVVGGEGPRATPTIAGELVFTMGGTGLLNCLQLKTGALIWQKHVLKVHGTKANDWGVSWSPLVLDSLLVISAGGGQGPSLAAYRAHTGDQVWVSGNDRSGYSSPLLANLGGMDQVLVFNDTSVTAHRLDDGYILWKYPWPADTETVAQPIILPEDHVLITSGYGVGSKLLKISSGTDGMAVPSLVWESNRLKAKFTNVIYDAGYVYGLDDGILTCIDAGDGKRKWKQGRYGHGQILLVDDLLLVQAESGDIALVEARPDEFIEVARYPALEGKTWNNPAFAAPYLLVRNSKEAACYELVVLN